MARVPRYSRSARVVTEVQPSYTPAAAEQAKMFDTVREGFDAGVKFLRPAVTQEQTLKGEKQAQEAFEKGAFEMRRPFTIRDEAFNATGERLVTNRAMIELDNGFRDALKTANGNMRVLETKLQELNASRGELPDIPGLQTRWLESFERGANTARRQTTALAERRAAAAARAAANEAVAAAKAETERLAFAAGTPEELTAALTAGIDNIAQFGPRGEFEVGGVTYPADPNRQGTLTPRQIENQATQLRTEATTLFLSADLERSDAPALWAQNLEEELFERGGIMGLPPSQSFELLQDLQRTARADESARLRAENAEAERIRNANAGDYGAYLVAGENGMAVPIPEDVRNAMRERTAGNAELAQELEITLATADAISTLNALSVDQRAAYIQNARRMAAADGRITPQEAAVIQSLAPHLKAVNQAISRETVGVSAAEQLFSSGSRLPDDELAQMAKAAAGSPKVAAAVEELRRAYEFVDSMEGHSGVEREEILNATEAALQEALIEGDNNGANVQLSLNALERAEQYFDALTAEAKENPTEFARKAGVALDAFPTDPEAGVDEIVGTLASRVAALAPVAADYGNPNPVPLSGPEAAAMGEWMQTARNSTRVALVDSLYQALPRDQADAIIGSLGVGQPSLVASARLREGAPVASATVLAGMGVTVKHEPNARATAEVQLAPFLGEFNIAGRERIMATAEAYAAGKAAEAGQSETQITDWETGVDLALGADDQGRGGIENVRGYGMAILPTGVTGAEVRRGMNRLTTPDLEMLAGGVVEDRLGVQFDANSFLRSVEGFRLDPTDPSRLIPLDDRGDAFIVNGHGGLRPLSLSVEDLIGG